MSAEQPDQQSLVDALERLLTVWEATRHAAHDPHLRHQRDAAAEAVWHHVQLPLRGWAQRWVQRGRRMQIPPATPEGEADQLETLALQAYSMILLELQRNPTGGRVARGPESSGVSAPDRPTPDDG